jgi:hypothetical protein
MLDQKRKFMAKFSALADHETDNDIFQETRRFHSRCWLRKEKTIKVRSPYVGSRPKRVRANLE